MGITSWVKSFTVLELVLSFLIIIVAIVFAISLTYFLTDDSKSEETPPSVINFNITNDNETDEADEADEADESRSFFSSGVLSGLNDTVLDITPKDVLTEYKEYAKKNKTVRILSTGRINTHQNFTLVTALMNTKKPDQEKCSCLIVSEQFAITTASCSKHIKLNKDYAFLEFTNTNGKIKVFKTNELSKVIVHHQFKEGSEQYDVAMLKSTMKFKLPQQCYAHLLSHIATDMIKVGDAVVVISWNMTQYAFHLIKIITSNLCKFSFQDSNGWTSPSS